MGLKVVVGLHLYSEEDISRVLEYFNTYCRYTMGDRGIPDIKISGIRVLDLKTLEYFDFTIEECNKLEYDLVSSEDSVEEIGDIDRIVLGVPDTFSRFDSYIHFERLFNSIRSVLPIYYDGNLIYKDKCKIIHLDNEYSVGECLHYIGVYYNIETFDASLHYRWCKVYGNIDLKETYILNKEKLNNAIYHNDFYCDVNFVDCFGDLAKEVLPNFWVFNGFCGALCLDEDSSDTIIVPNGVTFLDLGTSNWGNLPSNIKIVLPPSIKTIDMLYSTGECLDKLFISSKTPTDVLYDFLNSLALSDELTELTADNLPMDRDIIVNTLSKLKKLDIRFY